MLVVMLGLAAFALFLGVRDLRYPETCDGRAMTAGDTCRHYGRGSEQLQSPATTTVTLPPRPTMPPGMDVPDIGGDLPPTVTATVAAGDGKSRADQARLNRIEGSCEVLLAAGLLIAVIGWIALRARKVA